MYHFISAFAVLTLFSKHFLSAWFIIHGLTSRKLPCRGLPDMTLDGSTLARLGDTSHDTCVKPLSYGYRLGKLILEIFNITQTTLEIVTAISPEASCHPPGVVLAAETTSKDIVECILADDDDTTGKFRICRHTCFCRDCCLYIHIHFNSLRASRLQNTQWQLCDLQVCYDWHTMTCTKWPPCCKRYFLLNEHRRQTITWTNDDSFYWWDEVYRWWITRLLGQKYSLQMLCINMFQPAHWETSTPIHKTVLFVPI